MLTLATLHYLVFKPTLKIIKERENKTEALKVKTNQTTIETQTILEKYHDLNEKISQESKQIRDDILDKAIEDKNNILSLAKKQATKHLNETRKELDTITKATSQSLMAQAKTMAKEIYQKLVA